MITKPNQPSAANCGYVVCQWRCGNFLLFCKLSTYPATINPNVPPTSHTAPFPGKIVSCWRRFVRGQSERICDIPEPSILARFYTDYSGSSLPQGDIFENVLREKYGVAANRVQETINLLLDNARHAKLLEDQQDGRLKLLSISEAAGVGTAHQKPSTDGASPTGQLSAAPHVTTDYSPVTMYLLNLTVRFG